jgi:membrane protease YdiL (CAAX protease family)
LKQGFFVLRFNRHKLPRYFLLLLVGTFAGLILFQFKEPVQLERHFPILLLFYGFVLVIAMAFLEEWLFRGIMQTALMKLSDTGIAVVVVALFYTILHISWNPWPFVLLIFLMAVGLGWLRRTSDNLLDVCLVHGAANITFFLILPLLKPI